MAVLFRRLQRRPVRDPAQPIARPPAADRIRVVEVLATGTNGGAQEHLFGLLSRLDRDSLRRRRVVSLSHGSTVRKLQRAGIRTIVIDEPDDAIATAHRSQPPGAPSARMSSTTTCTARRSSARRRPSRWLRRGYPRPYVVSTVHSSRVRPAEDREELRRLTPCMDRLIAVSRAIVSKIEHEGRLGAPRSR